MENNNKVQRLKKEIDECTDYAISEVSSSNAKAFLDKCSDSIIQRLKLCFSYESVCTLYIDETKEGLWIDINFEAKGNITTFSRINGVDLYVDNANVDLALLNLTELLKYQFKYMEK